MGSAVFNISGRKSALRRNIARGTFAAVSSAALVTGVAGVAGATASEPQLAGTADTSVWGTNGRVTDIQVVGNRAILAGAFDYLGPTTGHDVLVDASGASLDAAARMSNNVVYTSVSDGAGGYYVGGSFTQIGGIPRKGVAHVLANGKVDRNFKAQITGTVYAVAVRNGNLVVGGSFKSVNGTTASNLVLLDAAGNRVAGWSGSANGTVNSVVFGTGGIYVGGAFSSLSGSSRSNLGRVSATTGLIDGTFSSSANSVVRSLALSADGLTLYAGGDFTTVASSGVGSSSHSRLAAFSATTGAVVGSFAASADARVNALAVDPTAGTVYAAGEFANLNGQPRVAVGAVTPAGALGGFDAALTGCYEKHVINNHYSLPPCTTQGTAVAVSDGAVYLGGSFTASQGTVRHDAAAFALASGALTSWNPVAGDKVRTITPVGSGFALGGDFTSTGGILRKGLAAIDLTTGQADPGFTADTDNIALDLEPTADKTGMYVAGAFATVGGLPRLGVALVNTTTGAVADFRAKPNNTVTGIALQGNSLWIGGKFTKVTQLVRQHTAKLNATTGAVDPTFVANTWGPAGSLRAKGMVEGLAVSPDGSKVYLGGPFDSLNGSSISGGIAVVNGTTGVQAGTLGGVQGCGGIGPWINHLYLSPDGARLYAGDVCPDYIYQYDAVNLGTPSNPTGLLWRTWCNGGSQGSLEVNGRFYFGSHGGDKGSGGVCSSRPGGPNVERSRFAVFDQASGYLLNFAPTFDTPMGVWTFAAAPQGLLVGGDFTLAGDRTTVQQGFALFRGTP